MRGPEEKPSMKYSTTEADARIKIDSLLRLAGWDPSDKSQVRTEVSIPDSPKVLGESPMLYGTPSAYSKHDEEDQQRPSRRRSDYVLLNPQGRPLAVIEAKRSAINPYTAKQQTLPYAESLGAPFIFLTNGELIYFWDYKNDDARLVHSFFSQRDLEWRVEMRSSRKPLATIEIPKYYMRLGESRQLRPYQREAMQAMDHAQELGKQRFLIELPTGTGKTDLVTLYVRRMIQAGRAERILFLTDREQLAKQALEAVQDLLNQYSSYWLRPGIARQEQQITVCLLQTMIGRYQEFTSGYFDVVIADECHRSIYGAWQAALTHFDAFHIGLTATPASYIGRNTFDFYQCNNNQPDFSFPIQEAFKKGFLVPYRFASGITQLLAEGTEIDSKEYDPVAFERKWTNEDTNRKMIQEFDRLAWTCFNELAPGQKIGPGKTIVFAITKHHAARLAQYLNELHPELNGQYAEVITSDVFNVDELIRKFKQEVYPQIAVSVGMLDTGFDCREILHLVMCRRIRSAILYQQMRGRGTRTADHIQKNKFVIYDFFGNHQYFNDSETDVFGESTGGIGRGHHFSPVESNSSLVELGIEDEWLNNLTYVEIGPGGERVDKREYCTNWEQSIRSAAKDNPIIKKIRAGQSLTDNEEESLIDYLNKPEMYFNEDNLRNAYQQPAGSLIDFIRAALGHLKLKTKEDIVKENFQAWLTIRSFSLAQAEYLSLLKSRGIVRGNLNITDLFQPPLSLQNAGPRGVELFGEKELVNIITDLNHSVFSNQTA